MLLIMAFKAKFILFLFFFFICITTSLTLAHHQSEQGDLQREYQQCLQGCQEQQKQQPGQQQKQCQQRCERQRQEQEERHEREHRGGRDPQQEYQQCQRRCQQEPKQQQQQQCEQRCERQRQEQEERQRDQGGSKSRDPQQEYQQCQRRCQQEPQQQQQQCQQRCERQRHEQEERQREQGGSISRDPQQEYQQCQHRCQQEPQQHQQCEQRCERQRHEQEERQREQGGSRSIDPQQEYQQCQRRCQQEPQQQQCQQRCERQRQEQEERQREQGGNISRDPQQEYQQCQRRCQQEPQQQRQQCQKRCERHRQEQEERQMEQGGSRSRDPQQEYQQCQRRCQQEPQQQQQQCQQRCEQQRQEQEERQREQSGSRSRDPQQEYQQCQRRCQEGSRSPTPQQQQQCQQQCEERRREQEKQQEKYQQCQQRCQQQVQGQGQQQQQRCQQRCEDERQRQEQRDNAKQQQQQQESNNPYFLDEQSFKDRLRTEHGYTRVSMRFSEISNLLRGIENYRLGLFEANPSTFLIPHHLDADAVFVVVQGRGLINLVHQEDRQTYNLERGDVIRVPAGALIYLINRDNNQKFQIVSLFKPVSTPSNKFREFFGVGGENPESFYNTFSDEILEAAFDTDRKELDSLFRQQRSGEIVQVSQEQIRALSRDASSSQQGNPKWSKHGSQSWRPVNLLNQRPTHSNEYGKLYDVTPNDYPQLQDLDVAVSYHNINKGAMVAPFYNSRATSLIVVVNGNNGRFEMACPHLSSSQSQREGRETREQEQKQGGSVHYKKVSARLSPRTSFIVPAGHPISIVASDNQNLEIVAFKINVENNQRNYLAGQNNLLKKLQREAKELAFSKPAREVDTILNNQRQSVFLPGPNQRQQREEGCRGGMLIETMADVLAL